MHTERRRERLIEVARARQQGVVVLEDIHDPHNAEAVFRSCDAMGFQRVCLVFEKSEPFDPRRIGKISSASANKWLTFETYDSTTDCLGRLHDEGYELVATVLAEDAEPIFEADFTSPRTALLFGNEHRGLSEQAVALADRKLMIPMRGMVQSLNLSVTAALCLYELTRQRMAHGIDGFLYADDEQQALADEFLVRGS
jgi:tRNA (guanosine-2'-O-)-methyltransferase